MLYLFCNLWAQLLELVYHKYLFLHDSKLLRSSKNLESFSIEMFECSPLDYGVMFGVPFYEMKLFRLELRTMRS